MEMSMIRKDVLALVDGKRLRNGLVRKPGHHTKTQHDDGFPKLLGVQSLGIFCGDEPTDNSSDRECQPFFEQDHAFEDEKQGGNEVDG
jgi:hypothetical protein